MASGHSAGGPAASPALIRDGPAGQKPTGTASLSGWQVPALIFEPEAARAILAALGPPVAGQPDGRSGRAVTSGSVHYLAPIAALAADLAARAKVLPGLTETSEGSSLACWRTVLAGPDALRGRE